MSHSVWFLIVFCHSTVSKFGPSFFSDKTRWHTVKSFVKSHYLEHIISRAGTEVGAVNFQFVLVAVFFKDLDISITFYNTVVCRQYATFVHEMLRISVHKQSQSWLANGTYIHVYFDQNSEPSFSITHRKYSKSLFFCPFQLFHYLRSRF